MKSFLELSGTEVSILLLWVQVILLWIEVAFHRHL